MVKLIRLELGCANYVNDKFWLRLKYCIVNLTIILRAWIFVTTKYGYVFILWRFFFPVSLAKFPSIFLMENLFFVKTHRFWSNFKEHWNDYLIMFEIFTNIFDISTKIRPYNDRDFEPNVELKMIEVLTQIFNISTKVRDILNKISKMLTTFSRFWSNKLIFWRLYSALLPLPLPSTSYNRRWSLLYSSLFWVFSSFSTLRAHIRAYF